MRPPEMYQYILCQKSNTLAGAPVQTAQNVPVHFRSKVRHPVETAQNVPVHFNKPLQRQPHDPREHELTSASKIATIN